MDVATASTAADSVAGDDGGRELRYAKRYAYDFSLIAIRQRDDESRYISQMTHGWPEVTNASATAFHSLLLSSGDISHSDIQRSTAASDTASISMSSWEAAIESKAWNTCRRSGDRAGSRLKRFERL